MRVYNIKCYLQHQVRLGYLPRTGEYIFDDEKRFVVESWESVKDQASFKGNSMGPKSYSNNLHDEFTRKIYYPISI